MRVGGDAPRYKQARELWAGMDAGAWFGSGKEETWP